MFAVTLMMLGGLKCLSSTIQMVSKDHKMLLHLLYRAGFSERYINGLITGSSLDTVETALNKISGSGKFSDHVLQKSDHSLRCNTTNSKVGMLAKLDDLTLKQCMACNDLALVTYYEVIYADDLLPFEVKKAAQTEGMYINWGDFSEQFGNDDMKKTFDWSPSLRLPTTRYCEVLENTCCVFSFEEPWSSSHRSRLLLRLPGHNFQLVFVEVREKKNSSLVHIGGSVWIEQFF